MKITTEVSPVTTGGKVGEAKQFGINATREAFEILSSRLYNDKIAAIIRELSCNAYDSQVAAGNKDKPFEIHLPTRWEPWFAIKDSGTGLSDEEVHELYTTYFGTNRNQSNEFIGALGLGSKSPFAYTKMFSVESRHKGKTRHYSASLDDGLPMIRQLGDEADSVEPDGLTIQFSVNENDISEFINKASIVYEFFNPLPKSNIKFDVKKHNYSIRTDRWALRTEYTYGVATRAVQGAVAYNVGSIDHSKLSEDLQEMIRLPLDLFFPIGSLSVAASRETLSNDDFTVNNVVKALHEMRESLVETVKQQIDKCKSEWEARLLIFNLVGTSGLSSLIQDALSKGLFTGQYTNFTFRGKDPEIKEADYLDVLFFYFRQGNGQYATKARHSRQTRTQTSKLTFETSPQVAFVINDIGFGAGKYINYFLQESEDCGKIEKVYYVDRAHQGVSPAVVAKSGLKLIAELGNPPYFTASGLQRKYREELDQTKTPTVYAKKGLQAFCESANLNRSVNGYEQKRWRQAWEDTSFPTTQGTKLYLQIRRGAPLTGGFEFADQLKELVQLVKKSELLDDFKGDAILYGIPADTGVPRGWEEFTNFVFKEIVSKMNAQKELELSLYLKPYHEGYEDMLKYIATHKLLHPDSPMQKFAEKLTTATNLQNKDSDKVAALGQLLKKAEHKGLYKVSNIVDFNIEGSKLKQMYPILSLVSSYTRDSIDIRKLIDYFKIVDERNGVGKVQAA